IRTLLQREQFAHRVTSIFSAGLFKARTNLNKLAAEWKIACSERFLIAIQPARRCTYLLATYMRDPFPTQADQVLSRQASGRNVIRAHKVSVELGQIAIDQNI